ncbi:MAG: phospholipid carrier-dependent glycosyltransferase [Gemmatimonadetes bacterium]|nr:phospholipid carrier-dependent glycosyltransferase [Gemmatimonadota bacterium]
MRAVRRWSTLPPELLVLTALSFLTRGWRLFTPGEIVWDELHFEFFASRYFNGAFYFDVHPPLGKLLFAAEAWLLRVPGQQLIDAVSAPQLRLLPALAGALIIPTFWYFLRELGANRRVALFGATLLLLDNALLVLSRFVLMDSMLTWFGLAAVTAFLAARRHDGRSRFAWLAAAALLGGAAASVKWTGLTALGLMGFVWLVDLWRERPVRVTRRLAELLVLVAVPAAVYLGSFAVHFALLPNEGMGTHEMSPAFAATRVGNPAYKPGNTMPFVDEVVDLHHAMTRVNLMWATDSNPGASKWYTWPISKHPVAMWTDDHANGDRNWILLQGNPVLWWGILVGLALFVVALALRRTTVGAHRDVLLFLLAGYVMNFVPFAFITRPMYLYHYFFGLLYSLALATFATASLAGWHGADDDAPWRFPSRWSRGAWLGVIALVAVSFVYFAPLSYGTRLSPEALWHRRWILERH